MIPCPLPEQLEHALLLVQRPGGENDPTTPIDLPEDLTVAAETDTAVRQLFYSMRHIDLVFLRQALSLDAQAVEYKSACHCYFEVRLALIDNVIMEKAAAAYTREQRKREREKGRKKRSSLRS